jgi:predicted negative regulator of RcsB-dependent stress response/Flp pilus assembly protein TadD
LKYGKALAAASVLTLAGLAARADLALWVQHQPSGPLLDVLLRSMPLPGGAVRFRRPPSETRPALTKMIGAEPKNAALYRLRAREDEMQLDFSAAETDWKAYADLASDRGAGYLELADFYHRRVRALEEIGALQAVGAQASDPFLPAASQRAWTAYERMLPVIKDAGLPAASTAGAFRSWIARYPKEPTPRREFVNFLLEQKQYASAETQISAYAKAFPEDGVFPIEARASLAAHRDSDEAALRVYDKAFRPLWPKELLDAYFALLNKNEDLRGFLARARTARDRNPGDLDATARLFAYYRHTNNTVEARRVLLEYRLAKEAKPGSWTAEELKTMTLLFDDANERARMYYALYSLPGASAGDRETALGGMVDLLLNQADQPIRFGSGDLSLYKDIGTVDSSPGFLNGLLSLVLNSTSPHYQYEQQNAAAGAYFHRAEGARLLELFEKEFPASARRSELRSSLVDAYASYGDDEGVIAAGRAFLRAFPKSAGRTHVALALGDALARKQRTQEEFAVYEQMLSELASKAGGVPLGAFGGADKPKPGPRSSDYAMVLEKYLARLSALHQPMPALAVYRREMDRNPNDPGLYERFAGFLEQNNLGADVQDVYRRAIAKFPDKSWYDKLARWYLRGRQQAAFTALSREATGIFSGTELEAYFRDVVGAASLGPALYLQLNLYAHQRYPEDLAFVYNLWTAYGTRGTVDAAAADQLLHDYWFYDPVFKRLYFEHLSARGQLLNQIAAVQKTQSDNPAAIELNAEAEAWLGHFEAAAPGLRATAELYPGSVEKNATASSLYRSLAAYFPADTQVAAVFARKAYEANPPDTKRLETVGDIYSDQEDLIHAAAAWDAIPKVFPGKPDGYLETATVFWDYYRFSDALKLIQEARAKYRDKALFAYEAGAIEEGRRDYQHAVEEYLAGWAAGSQPARSRIVRLATRPAQRDLIERMTANADPDLRIDILKAQQRKPELEAFLTKEIAVATRVPSITPLVDAAREQGFEAVERQGLEREIAVTLDPVERMRLRIELVKYLETRKDVEAAARAVDALYRDNPLILGVVRARVDFDKRNKRDADAIAALTDAAAKARADLSAQFRFEAARTATDSGRIDQARSLLSELLRADPYRADYIAGMADTYAAAKDDAGFVQFATSEIDALKKAPLPPDDRKTRIAALRRRLIVTLAHRNDYAGAVEQYIEVIDAYPDDKDVAREAALFASAHGRRDQLISFYAKTIAAAPRDWRWPIVLARIETAMEDYPAALNAYETAMKARPDRADLVQDRAELEERLLRFDDASKSCSKLYQLTYHDPQWLDKAAEFQARLGHRDEAVATLEKAHIGAGGETVSGLFAIATLLDRWHLAADAARYAGRGFALAGKDMVTKYPAELITYAEIMAGVRRDDAIVAIGGKQTNAIRAAGTRIAQLYTPEEKAALAARPNVGQPLAESAGLEEKLAQLLSSGVQLEPWTALQTRRGLYEEIAARAPPDEAALAASRAGDFAAAMRIYARMQAAGNLVAGPSLDRYLNLLLEHDPRALVAQKSDRAAQIAIQAGNESIALQTLRADATSKVPVWLNSYTALTGVYFDDKSPDVNRAFVAALGPESIGQRLVSKPDPDRSLVGSIWFYYGARFGEYLTRAGATNAADYLPSSLEIQPANPDAYIDLGRFDTNAKLLPNAVGEFRKALDLDADRGEAHDGIARVLMQQGRRADAIAEWREALAAFQREQSRGVRVRDSFWAHVGAAIEAIVDAKAFTELQPDIHRLLANYHHINGDYRFGELMRPVLEASFHAGIGFDWLLDFAFDAYFDDDAQEQEWMARYRLALALRRTNAPLAAVYPRAQLINLLMADGKVTEALDEWHKFTAEERETLHRQRDPIEIRIAAAEGTIDQLIAGFRTDPANPYVSYLPELLRASTMLREDGHVPAALSLLEFAYTRELDRQHLEIANFLGLARVYLERGNQADRALATLRRMTLVAGEPFEAFEPAGDLLAEFHRDVEAREFYAKAIQATPWNASAKVKLASRAGLLQVIADTTASYALRAEAAQKIAPSQAAVTGELALLASGDKTPAAARKPFFVESRLTAASNVSDPSLKLSLLREALAIAPDDRRVRTAAMRAAINAHNDSLALAMNQVSGPVANDRDLLKALSLAAERTGNLMEAERFLREAGEADVKPRLALLAAERKRRDENLRRQPDVTGKLEQPQIVRPRIVP